MLEPVAADHSLTMDDDSLELMRIGQPAGSWADRCETMTTMGNCNYENEYIRSYPARMLPIARRQLTEVDGLGDRRAPGGKA